MEPHNVNSNREKYLNVMDRDRYKTVQSFMKLRIPIVLHSRLIQLFFLCIDGKVS